jgi:hypothetical protein
MNPHQPQLPAINKQVVSISFDLYGNVILLLRTGECLVAHPDGSYTRLRVYESQELACGAIYHAGMSQGPNPVLTAVCGVCRRPCLHEAGHACAGCGIFLCPRHARVSDDGEWRCSVCRLGHSVSRGLKHVFFRLEEE